MLTMMLGSDTSAGVLVLIFYHLLSNVDVYNRLTSELDDHFPNKELQPEDHEMLLSLPYLTAVVNEGLRLSTPFPGFPRIVPKEGIVIEGRFIPPGTTVGIPIYAQQTSPLNFWPDPYGFKPERWLEGGLGPGSILRPDALMSFQFGEYTVLLLILFYTYAVYFRSIQLPWETSCSTTAIFGSLAAVTLI